MNRYRFLIFLGLVFLFLNIVFFAASSWHEVDLARDWLLLIAVELVTVVVSAIIALKADHFGYEQATRRLKRKTGLFKR